MQFRDQCHVQAFVVPTKDTDEIVQLTLSTIRPRRFMRTRDRRDGTLIKHFLFVLRPAIENIYSFMKKMILIP